ncbi:MAG TPA: alanine racemase [Silvibacterium sp.]|nr:alanine racemase [Silvibacterium sp.]
MTTRPVWAEISRQRLIENYRLLRRLAGNAELLAIIKANAYGHGVFVCAEALAAENPHGWLGVTGVEEGAAVRAVAPHAHIVIMGSVWQSEAGAAIEHRLIPVVWEPSQLDALQSAATARRFAPASIPVHLEIDTGMSRQGVRIEALPTLLEHLSAAPALRLESVMTHLHSPEALDGRANAAQLETFVTALDTIATHGFRLDWIHAGNSATALSEGGAAALVQIAAKYKAKAMLRPGLALYGYAPRFSSAGLSLAGFSSAGFSGTEPLATGHLLKPVLAWKTRIVSLRTIQPGETAGYCATFRASRTTRIALLPVGYADGLNRLLSNRGSVLVRGQRALIVGRISMDLTTVDVTDIPGVEIGDEVVLIGQQDHESITAYDHADLAGTIPYEILGNVAARVPRIMKD